MLPGIYEFHWDAGHVIFVGGFLLVLLCVAASVVVALLRTRRDIARGHAASICWHEEFKTLPPAARTCRHVFDGTFAARTCERGFGCDACDQHAELTATRVAAAPDGAGHEDTAVVEASRVHGIDLPHDRLYDRGHTWVLPLAHGTVRIGLDALGEQLLRGPDAIELPEPGTRLVRHGPAWRVRSGGSDVSVRSPVAGLVRATGGPEQGWYLEVETGADDLTHLLRGAEAGAWMQHEVERLVQLATGAVLEPALADGGAVVIDASLARNALIHDEIFLQA